jgi:hypothetical protein
MDFKEERQKLINYIEENLRTSDETKATFIDPRNYSSRLFNKQNQVIFGRRGSGKSLLIKSLKDDNKTVDYVYVKANLEDYKDTSFPNSILHVLIKILKDLKPILRSTYKWYQFKRKKKVKALISRIDAKLKEYREHIKAPDNYDEDIKKTSTRALDAGAEGGGIIRGKLSGSISEEKEIQRKWLRDKASLIKNEIPALKDIFFEVGEVINKSIFIGLDDFYFIRKLEQPYFIDFFHRLTKDTKLYLKVATIRYRSKLYTTTDETYVGTELGHDIQEIDLDYTLDRYDLMQSFMRELLNESIRKSYASLQLASIFSDNGFKQLCLASGGVPRDFLSLTVKLLSSYVSESRTVSKIDVTEVAISNFSNKLDAYAKDSAEEKQVLDLYLSYLKSFLLSDRKTNMFLVPTQEIEDYPQINQAIKELTDLRMIHLVEPITSSAPSDGKKYSAYMIDIGLYPNSKPRNFNQIEPGTSDDKSRKDQIRSAPKLNLFELNERVTLKSIQLELDLSV